MRYLVFVLIICAAEVVLAQGGYTPRSGYMPGPSGYAPRGTPSTGKYSRYYSPSGSSIGSSATRGNATTYYNRYGSSVGRVERHGNAYFYFDRSGSIWAIQRR
jgi:hypothetical protein